MTDAAPPLSGVVMAGGGSRRMGADKALLRVDGVRLVDRAVAALREVCDDVVVASGVRPITGLPVPQIPDEPPDAGPLGGLIAALRQAHHDLVAVLAVDMPTPDTALLAALAARWQGEAALIPSAGGRPQPLHAIWARAAGPSLTAVVAGGTRSVVDAVSEVGGLVLDDLATAALVAHDRWTWNVNRPGDLARGMRSDRDPGSP